MDGTLLPKPGGRWVIIIYIFFIGLLKAGGEPSRPAGGANAVISQEKTPANE